MHFLPVWYGIYAKQILQLPSEFKDFSCREILHCAVRAILGDGFALALCWRARFLLLYCCVSFSGPIGPESFLEHKIDTSPESIV